MLDIGIRRPEDAALFDGSNLTRHIKSQSFKIAYDEPSSLNGRLARWVIMLS